MGKRSDEDDVSNCSHVRSGIVEAGTSGRSETSEVRKMEPTKEAGSRDRHWSEACNRSGHADQLGKLCATHHFLELQKDET